MQRFIIIGVLLCILSSFRRQPSTELLAQDKMVTILVDLAIAKAMVQHYTDDEATASGLFKKNALLIYQAHDVDLDTFQKSYQYYLTHLELMKEIYEMVIKRLEELKGKL
jgi:hypothetical protein